MFLITALFCQVNFAASIDTAVIYSQCMHKDIKCVIIKPDTYKNSQTRFPVVFLLHGYSDHFDIWVKKIPAVKIYADQMQMIIVCPDGGFSSWYFDSPVDSSYKYETHISREVVIFIDGHYRTIPDGEHRAITGLSMGGHGSLYLALRHPFIFGAAGSMSGGVDLRPFPDGWDIAKRIGDQKSHWSNWENMSVINMTGHYPTQSLSIIFDCGTDDFFYQANLQLHEKMMELKIPHDFIQRPGGHTLDYWKNAIEYQLLFFKKHFENHGKMKQSPR